VSIKPIANKRT